MNRFSKIAAVGSALAVASMSSHAALDAAVSAAITDAGTNMGLVYTALTTVGAALWVARLVYRKFTVR